MKNIKKYIRFRKCRAYGNFYQGLCPECGNQKLFYYFRYDAEACLQCDLWLAPKCSDPDCPYCANRPDSPEEALMLEEIPHDAEARKLWRRENYQHKHDGRIRHQKRKNFYQELTK